MSGAHTKRRAWTIGLRLLGWVVLLLVAIALGAFVTVGANGPADPTLGGIPGFGEVALRVSPPGAAAPAAQFCALLAADDAQRAKGLMGRRDLAGFDAMVFTFDQDTSSQFFMRNVPIPLSIAWFDASGAFVSSADMAACGDSPDCPRYASAGPYRTAIETPQGGLQRLSIGPGARIEVGGPCAG